MTLLRDKPVIIRNILFVFVLLCLIFPHSGLSVTVEDETFNISVTGKKTWSLRLGLGDSRSLSQKGYPTNNFILDQTLTVDVEGTIFPYYSITANLDDQQPGYLQNILFKVDTDNWDGLLGDFSVGEQGGFAVYNKKLRGIKLTGSMEGNQIIGILSRVKGISKTKTFYGKSAQAEITYSVTKPERPWEQQPYQHNLRGLQFFPLPLEFVPDFTEPKVRFQSTQSLWTLLEDWGLGYLRRQISETPLKPLLSGQYSVISKGDKDYLLLLTPTQSLIRYFIKQYIDAYNERQGLKDDERKRYPFNEGTDYESKFLLQLEKNTALVVRDEQIALDQYERNRFYYLGNEKIEASSLKIEVKRDSEWTDIEELLDYNYKLFAQQGIVELNFPSSFFDSLAGKGVRVGFRYSLSGNLYMLGLSIAPQSERVYLNGELLQRGVDYSINYEMGTLMFFVEIDSSDKIRIDYETVRGGLGGFAQYKRNFYGARITTHPEQGFDLTMNLFRAKDQAPAQLSPFVPVMPNTHTVGGIEGEIEKGPWSSKFRVAGSLNQFPFDDNMRKNAPNTINDIEIGEYQGQRFILFAHQDGISVKRGQGWDSYSTADGLAANTVNDVVVTEEKIYFATSSGLTVLNMKDISPFDRAVNWKSYYESAGLVNEEVLSLSLKNDDLWIGTSEGLLRVRGAQLDDKANWELVSPQPLKEKSITNVIAHGESIWISTKEALYELEQPDRFEEVRKVFSGVVHDITVMKGKIYVASESGLYFIGDDGQVRAVIRGKSFFSLAASDSVLWFGTESGFTSLGSEKIYGLSKRVTALAVGDGVVWAGPRASIVDGNNYEMTVFRLAQELKTYSGEETRIEAKDSDRYVDISPEKHTNKGVYASFDLARDFKVEERPYSISSSVELQQPTYSPIGKLEREDSLNWISSLSGKPVEGLKTEIVHRQSLSNLAGEDSVASVLNRIDFNWDKVVGISGRGQWESIIDLKEILSGNLVFQDDWMEKKISAKLGFNYKQVTNLTTSQSKTTAGINPQIGLSPFQGLRVDLSYVFPLRFAPFSGGNEQFKWNTSFSRGFSMSQSYGFKLNLKNSGSASNIIYEGKSSLENSLSTELRFDKIVRDRANFTPYLSFGWDYKGNSNKFLFKISSHGQVDKLQSRVTVQRTTSLNTASGREDTSDKLSASVDFSEIYATKPKLTLSLIRSHLFYPSYGSKTKCEGKGDLSMSWELSPNLRNSLTLGSSYAPDRGLRFYGSDSVEWDIDETFKPRLSLNGEYLTSTGELDLDVKNEMTYKLQKYWQFSLVAGLNLRRDQSSSFHHSFFGAMTLAALF